MTESARAWGDMSPEQKVAWARKQAGLFSANAESDRDLADAAGSATEWGQGVLRLAEDNANRAAALTELADRIEREAADNPHAAMVRLFNKWTPGDAP